MERQHVDVDVAARHQHVGAADERRGHDAVGDDVDLPDVVSVRARSARRPCRRSRARRGRSGSGGHAGDARQAADALMKASMARSRISRRSAGGNSGRRSARPPAGRRSPLFDRQRLVDQLLAVRAHPWRTSRRSSSSPSRATRCTRHRSGVTTLTLWSSKALIASAFTASALPS